MVFVTNSYKYLIGYDLSKDNLKLSYLGGIKMLANFEIKNDLLIIKLNLDSKELSKSGKSYLLASSHGFQRDENTDIDVSFNVTRKK